MVGGGPNSIGATHRYAATLDGHYELVAAVFSRDAARNAATGGELGIARERLYSDFTTMAAAEAKHTDGIDCVTICTPNDTHAAASIAFMEHGIPVLCDKPIANSTREALDMIAVAERTGVLFGITHNFSAHPLVREARAQVRDGRIGKVRVVQVEYALGSRSKLVEAMGDTRFAWRADPRYGGPSTVLSDIGTHAHHLLRTITGLEVEAVSADLSSIVPGRVAHDNADVNLRLTGGARGHLWASMVASGAGQGLAIRVHGELGTLAWGQTYPDELRLTFEDAPITILRRGETWLCDEARRGTRVGRGNPAGHLEAFANVYTDFAEHLRARREGRAPNPLANTVASGREGLIGMAFVEACVASNARAGAWVDVAHAQGAAA